MKKINPRSHWYYGYSVVIALIVFIFVAISCKKNDDDPKKPVISSVSEGKGYAGDTVVISGEYFNQGAENTSVTFGTATAVVLSGTSTTITVKVPSLLPGTVGVTAKVGELASNTVDFTIQEEENPVLPIEFNSFEPKSGKYGTEITLYGANFTSDVEVYVNDKLQTPITVNNDSTEIKFNLTSQTYSGKVRIKHGTEEIENDTLLEYGLTYTKSDFSDFGGVDIEILDDGSYCLSYNMGLIQVNNKGSITDTLIKFDFSSDPSSLFLAKDGTLYIGDFKGKILYMEKGSKTIDTLIKDDANLPLVAGITGDNNGALFATTRSSHTIVKVDIASKTTEILANTTDDGITGIVLDNDSIFATTFSGMIRVHKNGGVYEYIVPKNSGYKFSDLGLCKHPSGDFFITSSDAVYGGFYRVNTKHEVIKEMDDLSYQGLWLDKNGDLYLSTASSVDKIKID